MRVKLLTMLKKEELCKMFDCCFLCFHIATRLQEFLHTRFFLSLFLFENLFKSLTQNQNFFYQCLVQEKDQMLSAIWILEIEKSN